MEHNVIESKEVIRVPIFDYVETGDLANEIGKKYMKDLNKSIERHSHLKLPKLYFIAMSRRDPTDPQKIFITIEALAKKLHYLREQMDHWEYDYVKNKLNLLWSVPHRSMMKNFLRAPEKYDKNFIMWIKQYIKQENLDLDDPTAQVIS